VGNLMIKKKIEKRKNKEKFTTYLKKYSEKYKLIKNDLNIYCIQCKYGIIRPYSIMSNQLCFDGRFEIKNNLKHFIYKLDKKCKIVHISTNDIIVFFNEKDLDYLSKIFNCHKKRKYSEEYRKIQRKRLKEARRLKKDVLEMLYDSYRDIFMD
jgi:hypothetical protein